MGFSEYDGPVEINFPAPGVMIIRAATSRTDDQRREHCAKCKRPFDPADARFDGRAQYRGTPFCRGCVDQCQSTEIADHWCAVDQHWGDAHRTDGGPDAG